ncbi:MAG: hypothetical protein OXG88_11720 [Gammaproteobacteria bacterium]|nr:hypothetical protein [Gammaproteobacteria bacterium]
MKTNLRITVWLSSCGCLILLTLGVFWWLSPPRLPAADQPTLATNPTLSASPHSTAQTTAVVNRPRSVATSQTAVANSQPATLSSPPLPPVAYSLGSLGEACDVNEYPPMISFFDLDDETILSLKNSPFDSTGDNLKPFKKAKCLTALETYMNPINPYLWGREDDTHGVYSAPAFITIDNPLTFERIFTDPAGDFARVQEALARPECQLNQNTKSNWQLNETCHADAIHNYALIMRFCYADFTESGVIKRPSQYYAKKDNPTPEQDRSMWIDGLQNGWVWKKCASLDPNLDLLLPVHTELRQQIQALQVVDENSSGRKQTLNGTLIELAAQLGDEAAGLTYPIDHGRFKLPYDEEGYKYGPLAEWFTTDLTDPTTLFSKHPPSVDRLRQFVPLFGKSIESKGKMIKFNHEVLVRHLCTPPYYTPPSEDTAAIPEPPSCRTIANELRQEFHSDQSVLKTIATFEEIAMRLDVYE